uniref:Uncharacterized protein n=1 Tax=Sus scrofa TaxID=9823 RepID=A0A8D1DQ59_PIG
MPSDQQKSNDESPSTSSGSLDATGKKIFCHPVKKNTKLSSKATAKLSTSAKRIQKELAEITLDPLNCSAGIWCHSCGCGVTAVALVTYQKRVKKEKILSYVCTTYISLEDLMLSEISQLQKDNYHIIPHLYVRYLK